MPLKTNKNQQITKSPKPIKSKKPKNKKRFSNSNFFSTIAVLLGITILTSGLAFFLNIRDLQNSEASEVNFKDSEIIFESDFSTGWNNESSRLLKPETTKVGTKIADGFYFGNPDTGNYSDGFNRRVGQIISNSQIQIPEIKEGESVMLTLDHKLEVEALLGFDKAEMIITNNQNDEIELVEIKTQYPAGQPDNNLVKFKGKYELDLSHYQNQELQISFKFDSIDGWLNEFAGWTLNNLKIEKRTAFEQQTSIATDNFNFKVVDNQSNLQNLWRAHSACSGDFCAAGMYVTGDAMYYNNLFSENQNYSTPEGRNFGAVESKEITVETNKTYEFHFNSKLDVEKNNNFDKAEVEILGKNNDGEFEKITSLNKRQLRVGDSFQKEKMIFNSQNFETIKMRFSFDTVDGISNNTTGWSISIPKLEKVEITDSEFSDQNNLKDTSTDLQTPNENNQNLVTHVAPLDTVHSQYFAYQITSEDIKSENGWRDIENSWACLPSIGSKCYTPEVNTQYLQYGNSPYTWTYSNGKRNGGAMVGDSFHLPESENIQFKFNSRLEVSPEKDRDVAKIFIVENECYKPGSVKFCWDFNQDSYEVNTGIWNIKRLGDSNYDATQFEKVTEIWSKENQEVMDKFKTTKASVDITEFAGKNISFLYVFDSLIAENHDRWGWQIDDMRLEFLQTEGFEMNPEAEINFPKHSNSEQIKISPMTLKYDKLHKRLDWSATLEGASNCHTNSYISALQSQRKFRMTLFPNADPKEGCNNLAGSKDYGFRTFVDLSKQELADFENVFEIEIVEKNSQAEGDWVTGGAAKVEKIDPDALDVEATLNEEYQDVETILPVEDEIDTQIKDADLGLTVIEEIE